MFTELRLLKYASAIIIFCVQIYGFWPYKLTNKIELKSTLFLRLYCYAAPILLATLLIDAAIHILIDSNVEFDTDTANAIQAMFSASCALLYILGYTTSYLYRSELLSHIIPIAIHLGDHIKQRHYWRRRRQTHSVGCSIKDMLLKFVGKVIVLPLIYISCEHFKLEFYAPRARDHPIRRFFLIIPSWIFFVLPNVFSCAMLTATLGYRCLNAELMAIIGEQTRMNRSFFPNNTNWGPPPAAHQRSYERMKRFCELSDQIDEISVLHMKLGRLSQRINSVFSVFIFFWCWHRMTYIISQLFLNYQIMSKFTMSNEIVGGDVEALVFSCLEVALIFVDFVMLTNICLLAELEVSG